MSNVFFTSDTHFGHGYMADLRGYMSVKEHDEALVEMWNSQVGKRDTVWHFGDVGRDAHLKGLVPLEEVQRTLEGAP